jgi:hypothetical protein
MNRRTAPILGIVLSIVFICSAVGAANAATVRGRLLHQNGYPAAGVAVTVYNQTMGRSSPAFAGADGMYYLYNIPPGNYYLEVWIYPNSPPVVYQIQVAEPYTDIPPTSVP